MIFEEMNKHIAIARILVGKSPRTELKDMRKTRITSGIINIEKESEYHSSNTQ
jgi:hypothetical protein